MIWKERLKALRGVAKHDREIEKLDQAREKELRRRAELLERRARSTVEKVCKAFARNVGWRLTTDTDGFAGRPVRVYLEPKLRSGEQVLERTGRKIIVAIDPYDQTVTVEQLPGLPGERLNPVAIPFPDLTEAILAAELERFYTGTAPSNEAQPGQAGVDNEEIPGALDVGWYWSENKNEFQMAKIAERDRATHMYVIGATGAGKTKFLEFLIKQDIQNDNGFAVIDPHGDLVEDIKGFLACHYNQTCDDEELCERVVLIDPTDPELTVAFNPLEKLPGVSVAEQAAELVSAFRKIWHDSWGVRMEDLMRNSLIALGEAELTLAELPSFLTDRAFRQDVLEEVEHPIARDYFLRFDALTDRGQIAWIEPVMNKINALLADERLRAIFASPRSTFNLREALDTGKWLLVKLDKGRLKDAADLLGSLLLAKLQIAAFSRSNLPQGQRTPFYLYIDEFQNFASESFMVLLSEARKYGLSLIMAHQTLAQLPEELRSLILGNTGIQVYFRVNRQDAQLLAKEAFEYSGYEVKAFQYLRPIFWTLGEEWEQYTEELQNLPPRWCYVKHKIEGGVIPIRTAEIEPAWEVLGMEEEEYREFLAGLPLGQKYLVSRKNLLAGKAKATTQKARDYKRSDAAEEPPAGADGHGYLQSLIKDLAEGKGYKATVETPTPDGLGRVDVSLERDGRRVAVEVSITTTPEHELGNIEKCLMAGYDTVILCTPEEKALEKVKILASEKLSADERGKVLFFKPEQVLRYLEQEETDGRQERVSTRADLWQAKVWHALRHLDDPSVLNQSSLARLAFIERVAEKDLRGRPLARGLALKQALLYCISKIASDGKGQLGLQKVCAFLELVKDGKSQTEISIALGVSREQVNKSYRKKAVELMTQEFLKLAKTRKS